MSSRYLARVCRRIPSALLSQRQSQLTCTVLHRQTQQTPVLSNVHVAPTIRCFSSERSFEVINVQDGEDFQKRVLESDIPIIVDFHAKWCGPCKLLGPRLESIISQNNGKINMAKVDVDDNAEIAIKYGVQSVPTIIAVSGGKVTDKFIGLVEDDKIKTFISKLIPQP